jgi:hypothetical protein
MKNWVKVDAEQLLFTGIPKRMPNVVTTIGKKQFGLI